MTKFTVVRIIKWSVYSALHLIIMLIIISCSLSESNNSKIESKFFNEGFQAAIEMLYNNPNEIGIDLNNIPIITEDGLNMSVNDVIGSQGCIIIRVFNKTCLDCYMDVINLWKKQIIDKPVLFLLNTDDPRKLRVFKTSNQIENPCYSTVEEFPFNHEVESVPYIIYVNNKGRAVSLIQIEKNSYSINFAIYNSLINSLK